MWWEIIFSDVIAWKLDCDESSLSLTRRVELNKCCIILPATWRRMKTCKRPRGSFSRLTCACLRAQQMETCFDGSWNENRNWIINWRRRNSFVNKTFDCRNEISARDNAALWQDVHLYFTSPSKVVQNLICRRQVQTCFAIFNDVEFMIFPN